MQVRDIKRRAVLKQRMNSRKIFHPRESVEWPIMSPIGVEFASKYYEKLDAIRDAKFRMESS
ncbi:hypothetical protein GCM10011282_20190 [Undibacterium macrobrachii]|uniref:Uncharacterized protein n=1 Tax=Undibacterium macrobrachii TaxID=1119058 RepID=A0ABQ2XET5_9BURK|nr:hypothetical protein GCM10011282_20190 [Undibacterium macrobrachii]